MIASTTGAIIMTWYAIALFVLFAFGIIYELELKA